MTALALEIDRGNRSHADNNMRLGGLFSHSSGSGTKGHGGDHGSESFTNFTNDDDKNLYGIAHRVGNKDGLKTENILARNLRQQFVFGANSPWGMQQNSLFKQIMDKAYDILGISSPVQKQETTTFLNDVTKARGFTAPIVSADTGHEEMTRKIIEANPALFALSASTGDSIKLDDLAETCPIPAGIKDMCGGQGLPEELAIPMFVAHMELNLEPTPALVANYSAPAPVMH